MARNRQLKLTGITICGLRFSKIHRADQAVPLVEKERISHYEIVRAARLTSFQHHPCLHFLQLLSQHVVIRHHQFRKLICIEDNYRLPVGIQNWYPQMHPQPQHDSHVGLKQG
jgi:hypothetical protein